MDGQTLLDPFLAETLTQNFQVSNLCNHSKKVSPGDLFFAYPGTKVDGREFIGEIIEKKPVAIVVEAFGLDEIQLPETSIPIIPIHNLVDKLGLIADRFYQHPSQDMVVTGITGTNGKTTISQVVNQALNLLSVPSAQIGTLGVISPEYKEVQGLTTPDAISVHKTLAKLKEVGVQSVSMEVSSHALSQGRVHGIAFNQAVFTNLTPDHLDYHQSMQAYGQAKLALFKFPNLEHVVLNDEDEFSQTIFKYLDKHISPVLYTTQPSIRGYYHKSPLTITTQSFKMHTHGLEADIVTPWGEGQLRSKLIGQFNLSNLLAALAVLCQQGIALDDALNVLAKVSPVPGRMQRIGGASTPQVIIDYAHTPDALKHALLAARASCKRTLWCVFGCGGNRDIEKRKQMGEIASQYADKIIITNDNPRDESPESIIEDILHGIKTKDIKRLIIEQDRQKAIEHAIMHALSYDVILVAGKGHENTQVIQQKAIPFSDLECVKKILSECA